MDKAAAAACTKCGRTNRPEAVYCDGCGTPLRAPVADTVRAHGSPTAAARCSSAASASSPRSAPPSTRRSAAKGGSSCWPASRESARLAPHRCSRATRAPRRARALGTLSRGAGLAALLAVGAGPARVREGVRRRRLRAPWAPAQRLAEIVPRARPSPARPSRTPRRQMRRRRAFASSRRSPASGSGRRREAAAARARQRALGRHTFASPARVPRAGNLGMPPARARDLPRHRALAPPSAVELARRAARDSRVSAPAFTGPETHRNRTVRDRRAGQGCRPRLLAKRARPDRGQSAVRRPK